jgi:hypothetical protein
MRRIGRLRGQSRICGEAAINGRGKIGRLAVENRAEASSPDLASLHRGYG